MYEYKVIKVKEKVAEKTMNEHAKEGWRVISNAFYFDLIIRFVITFEREIK
jgi:hypothetical protein